MCRNTGSLSDLLLRDRPSSDLFEKERKKRSRTGCFYGYIVIRTYLLRQCPDARCRQMQAVSSICRQDRYFLCLGNYYSIQARDICKRWGSATVDENQSGFNRYSRGQLLLVISPQLRYESRAAGGVGQLRIHSRNPGPERRITGRVGGAQGIGCCDLIIIAVIIAVVLLRSGGGIPPLPGRATYAVD